MRHYHYLIVAGLSLATSACLGTLPITAPRTALYPFIIANWIMMQMTCLMLRRRAKVVKLSWQQSKTWDRLFSCVVIAFTAAGVFAISAGNPMFGNREFLGETPKADRAVAIVPAIRE